MNWTNLQKCMEDYKDFLEQAMINNMPKYYELRNKITFNLQVNNTTFEIEFKAPEYWKYANYGRGPGKFPPPSAIDSWITRRKISPRKINGRTPTKNQLVYLISRKIAKYGFKGSGFLEKTLSEQEDYWYDRIIDAITLDIGEEANQWLSPLKGRTII